MIRAAWFTMGVVALALGALGVVLPILPTTPFVILAAFAFGKSSKRFEDMLLNSATFGPMIADWRKNGAIAPKYKAMAVGMMTAVFGLSLFLGVSATVLIIQAICLGGAAAFILTRPH